MSSNKPSNGDVTEWRNEFPIYQHFSAPSTTYVNLFRQPGEYNVTISLGEGTARRRSANEPIPSQQTISYGARIQANTGEGGQSMIPAYQPAAKPGNGGGKPVQPVAGQPRQGQTVDDDTRSGVQKP